MDELETHSIETYHFPLNAEDDREISRLVRARGAFAPSFVPNDDEDVYEPLTYRRQSFHHKTATILLADRNVVTRWLSLVSGKTASSEDRLAASIMAFAQSANILVEPNLALYEAAVAGGSEAANNELRQFRLADNLDTKHWADLAIGRIEKLSIPENELAALPNNSEEIDFGMRLRRWLRNYIILLKLAELELRGPNRIEQITKLSTWMYEDFTVGGPGLMFAIYYLAPNSARSGLLKNLRSEDRERALRGIQNASWDLTLLSDWIRRGEEQKEKNALTLLCSLDRKLMQLALILKPHPAGDSVGDFRRSTLRKILEPWGKKPAREISELIERFMTTPNNPSRQIHRPQEVDIDQKIAEGEKFIRDWNSETLQ
jgi:hypothetical protein